MTAGSRSALLKTWVSSEVQTPDIALGSLTGPGPDGRRGTPSEYGNTVASSRARMVQDLTTEKSTTR